MARDRPARRAVWTGVPLFYLHIRNGHGDQPDRAGVECVDARAAIAEAAKTAGEIVRDEVHEALADCGVRITVEDEDHARIGTIDVALSLANPT